MTDALILDDYGMLLLDKVRDAYDDYRAALEAKSQVFEGILKPDRYYYLSSSLRERDSVFVDLAIEFAGHVWMLETYPDHPRAHHLPYHATVSAKTMILFDELRSLVETDGPGSLAVSYLHDTVIPVTLEDTKATLS